MSKIKIQIDWQKILEKVLPTIILSGGEVMFKKLWMWIWAFGKAELIKVIKSDKAKSEFLELCKKYADPSELFDKVAEWLVAKIEKI